MVTVGMAPRLPSAGAAGVQEPAGGDVYQLPMLVMMVLFTTVGLWILAQPIQGGGP